MTTRSSPTPKKNLRSKVRSPRIPAAAAFAREQLDARPFPAQLLDLGSKDRRFRAMRRSSVQDHLTLREIEQRKRAPLRQGRRGQHEFRGGFGKRRRNALTADDLAAPVRLHPHVRNAAKSTPGFLMKKSSSFACGYARLDSSFARRRPEAEARLPGSTLPVCLTRRVKPQASGWSDSQGNSLVVSSSP